MAVAFDAQTTASRTLTTDPYTMNHTGRAEASGGIQGVAVMILCGTAATDEVSTVTYGGVALKEVQQATDTTGEPGNAQLWFLGRGTTGLGGTQLVSVDFTSATGTDHLVTVVTFTAIGSTEVIASGSISNDATNPSLTLSYQGRTAIAIGGVYSGLAAPTNLTPNANMTVMGTYDFGQFAARTDRQTTPGTSDFTYSYTSSVDDLAMVVAAISENELFWDERFAGGSDGVAITTLNSAITSVGSGGTMAFENTPFVPGGSTYCRITTTDGVRAPAVNYLKTIANQAFHCFRLYFRTDSPTAIGYFWQVYSSSIAQARVGLDLSATGALNMRDGDTIRYTSTKTLSANEWVRIEVLLDETANLIRGRMWWGQDLHSTSTTATESEALPASAWTSGTWDQIRFGILVQSSGTADFDGIAFKKPANNTDYIGPSYDYNTVPAPGAAYNVVGIPMN